MTKFAFGCVKGWPPLSWLAILDKQSKACTVRHGSLVETHDAYFCEAVWDGEYREGGFDKTDIVFGSGGRLRSDTITFVSSGSTVDRLQFIHYNGQILISNSLPCLMSAIRAEVDVAYPNYYQDFRSIMDGIQKYKKFLATSAGDIELVYFRNLEWEGSSLRVREKPNPNRSFNCFSAYKDFLIKALDELGKNMSSPERHQKFQPLGTLSTGYDSPTVSVLAKHIGLGEVLTFESARGGESDSGEEIARLLGLKPLKISRSAWRTYPDAEVPFLAMNAYGEEVHYRGAERFLSGRVLFTGVGGSVWEKKPKDISTDIVRADPTGTSLSEYRLWAGFLHCPVPLLGIRQIAQIAKISNSQEMEPWDVGRTYSRPICRRIIEEAGVPRHMFGVKKRAVSVTLFRPAEGFLPHASEADFLAWLRRNENAWTEKGEKSPLQTLSKTYHGDSILEGLCQIVERVALMTQTRPLAPLIRRLQWRMQALNPRNRIAQLFCHLFPWAIEKAKRRYQEIPPER